jgi:hypothetical protein
MEAGARIDFFLQMEIAFAKTAALSCHELFMKTLVSFCAISLLAASAFADIQDPPANDQGPTRKLGRGLANVMFCPTEFIHTLCQINDAKEMRQPRVTASSGASAGRSPAPVTASMRSRPSRSRRCGVPIARPTKAILRGFMGAFPSFHRSLAGRRATITAAPSPDTESDFVFPKEASVV